MDIDEDEDDDLAIAHRDQKKGTTTCLPPPLPPSRFHLGAIFDGMIIGFSGLFMEESRARAMSALCLLRPTAMMHLQKKKKANGHDASCQRKGRRRAQNGSTPPLRHQQTLVFWTFTLHLHCISHSVDAINSYIATKSPLLFRAQVWGDQAQLFATGSFFAGKSYLHRQAPPPHASRRQFCLFSRNTNLVRILHSFWMMMMRESVCVCVYE